MNCWNLLCLNRYSMVEITSAKAKKEFKMTRENQQQRQVATSKIRCEVCGMEMFSIPASRVLRDRNIRNWANANYRCHQSKMLKKAISEAWTKPSFRAEMSTRNSGYRRVLFEGIQFRSSWEAGVAYYLTEQGLTWNYEPRGFVADINFTKRKCYRPDFYVQEWKCYIEVKGWDRSDFLSEIPYWEQVVGCPIKFWDRDVLLNHGIINRSGVVQRLSLRGVGSKRSRSAERLQPKRGDDIVWSLSKGKEV